MKSLRQEREALEDRLRDQAHQLATLLLPDFSALQQARQWTGLDFLQDGLLEAIQEEREALLGQQKSLESAPDFQADPHQLQQQLQQESRRLQGHQAALLPFLQTCHQHPRFNHLLEQGYATSRYATPFWRLSYYADARAARELCQQTGKRNFAQLLADYRAAQDSYDVLSERQKELKQGRLTSGQQWQRLQERLEGLEQVHLSTAQTRIQLSLLKGGKIWERLGQPGLPRELAERVETTGLLKDQLDELMQRRL